MKSIWIARDKNGDLYAYKTRPKRSQDIWIDMAHYERGGTSKKLSLYWFPELTWQDEPIELTIKEKED